MLTWQNTSWDFLDAPAKIGILPLASTEPHSTHLPIGSDVILMDALARAVAERLQDPVFLLPTWPLGTSGHHMGEPGTITLRFDTLWAVVRDVVVSLHEHDIHHVAVINNHGSAAVTTTIPAGNFITKTAVRQLNYEVPGLTAIWVQPFAAARDELAQLFSTAPRELHAGAVETSIMMHLQPDLVGNAPADHDPGLSPTFLHFAPLKQVAPGGVWGSPSQASAEKGSAAFEAAVSGTVRYIERTFAQIAELEQ
jgi:creatinine amidohydrolase